MAKLILFNKPYGVLSQFTDAGNEGSPRETLSDYIDVAEVYAAGRLDRDSEGLLVLTDDGRLQAKISNPKHKMPKTYCVQVEGEPDEASLEALRRGIELKDGMTKPAGVRHLGEPDWLWPRTPPVRFRKTVPDCWLELTISEGRNRQVRRMTAAVGHPTLRLIRVSVGDWSISDIPSGSWVEVSPAG